VCGKDYAKEHTPHDVARRNREDEGASPDPVRAVSLVSCAVLEANFGTEGSGAAIHEETTYVCVSPLGERNQAAIAASTTIARPMKIAQLDE
jgi:hypothetical protein